MIRRIFRTFPLLFSATTNEAAQTTAGEGECDQKCSNDDQSKVAGVGQEVLDLLKKVFHRLDHPSEVLFLFNNFSDELVYLFLIKYSAWFLW